MDYKQIKEQYPNHIPIILKKHTSSKLKSIKKNKLFIKNNITFGQVNYIIRKKLKLDSSKALFLFINNTIYPQTLVYDIYNDYKIDNILYNYIL